MNVPHDYYLCTAGQCRQMDTKTIENFGIDGFTLMEIAGSSVAGHLLEELKPKSHGLYLCGKGNNAGDALVVARYLLQRGHKATLVFISGTDDLSSDTSHNLSLLEKINDNDPFAPEIISVDGWANFDGTTTFDFIVDGMLGTGLDSELRENYTEAVKWANRSNLPVFSIDIPTGLHADRGVILGTAIRARKTFTFGALKQGFYLNEGYDHAGEIVFCPLPFPNYLKKSDTFLLDDKWVQPPKLQPARHKYEAGILYIVAGSEGLTGAAVMASRSAWAEGIGAVILICPRGILPVFESTMPQIIKKPVGNQEDNCFKEQHLEAVLNLIEEKPGKVLFGPGLGRESSTLRFASGFFSEYRGSLMVDADALWCLAQQDSWNKPDESRWIITPHPGELSGILETDVSDQWDRFTRVRELAVNKEITVVSKGFPVIVGSPEGNCYLTSYDTRIFSRAGFGDVLAGKIGAYWTTGNRSVNSAICGLINGYRKAQACPREKRQYLEPNDLI